jgi:hypothetical protein
MERGYDKKAGKGAVGPLYVRKSALNGGPVPAMLVVTIEGA